MHTKIEKVSKETLMAIIAIAMIGFSGILSETSMNVTFPKMMSVYHQPLSHLQWITTIYLLAVAIMTTASAALKKNFGERQIFFTASSLMIFGTLLAALTTSFWVMLLSRVIQGVATGIIMPQMFNIILERVPEKKIGTYMGLGGLIISLAPAFGPTYGGFMISHFAWQWIFICILPFPIIASLIAYPYLVDSPKGQKVSFDFIGFTALSISLTMALLMISSLEKAGLNVWYLLIFLVTFALFLYQSLHRKEPFLDIRILKIPSVSFGLIPFFTFQMINLGINFITPNFIVLEKIASSSTAGMTLLPGTLLGAFLAPLLGKFYDEKGPKLSLYIGNSLFFLSLVLITIMIPNFSILPFTILYIVFTIGRNMTFNNTLTTAIGNLPISKNADATAIFQMMQQFAGALGTALAAIMANQASTFSKGVGSVYFLFAIFAFLNYLLYIGMFSSLKKGK
ncbi:XRE family transcriptional regulator [Streptococcus penaeicida]|uniref:XRE family transcriptional regulator n=1 Tax=Streptococcus penaeicida TaxID=1765960 RepID=A0A2N8LDQ1_9STRE|nr:MFS transporter [Streptococcus penaeicida]PND48298.1 XRE family transcriptional regulator [Streptococcus penaeicida]